MKLRLIVFETKSPAWVAAARDEYAGKLKPFVSFDVKLLKSPTGARDDAEAKRRREGELLLKQIGSDLLILFDEGGTSFARSEDLAKALGRALESGKTAVTFVIGGPYGFAPEVYARAQAKWSLSGLTMNHWIAQLAALEQMYRSFTILRGLPYHNR